jgi:hypothetical protein
MITVPITSGMTPAPPLVLNAVRHRALVERLDELRAARVRAKVASRHFVITRRIL